MKKIMLLTLSIFLLLSVISPTVSFDADRRYCKTPIKHFFKEDRLLTAVMNEESGFDDSIINVKENAVGILQIRPIMLDRVNWILKQQGDSLQFTLSDRFDSTKSVRMWYIVQKWDNPRYDPQTACYLWNGGVPRYKKMSHAYWLRIKNKINDEV